MNSKRLRIVGMILVVLALGSILLAACSRPGVSVGNNGGAAPTSDPCASAMVQTSAASFQESSVNMAKGCKLTVVPGAQSLHILANGSWVNGNAQPMNEPGAPTVPNVQVTSSPVQIGPFTTAGTFHIYCTVHPGMNLTVIVK